MRASYITHPRETPSRPRARADSRDRARSRTEDGPAGFYVEIIKTAAPTSLDGMKGSIVECSYAEVSCPSPEAAEAICRSMRPATGT